MFGAGSSAGGRCAGLLCSAGAATGPADGEEAGAACLAGERPMTSQPSTMASKSAAANAARLTQIGRVCGSSPAIDAVIGRGPSLSKRSPDDDVGDDATPERAGAGGGRLASMRCAGRSRCVGTVLVSGAAVDSGGSEARRAASGSGRVGTPSIRKLGST